MADLDFVDGATIIGLFMIMCFFSFNRVASLHLEADTTTCTVRGYTDLFGAEDPGTGRHIASVEDRRGACLPSSV